MRGSEESREDSERTARGLPSSKCEQLAAVRDYLAYPIKANRVIDPDKNKLMSSFKLEYIINDTKHYKLQIL